MGNGCWAPEAIDALGAIRCPCFWKNWWRHRRVYLVEVYSGDGDCYSVVCPGCVTDRRTGPVRAVTDRGHWLVSDHLVDEIVYRDPTALERLHALPNIRIVPDVEIPQPPNICNRPRR